MAEISNYLKADLEWRTLNYSIGVQIGTTTSQGAIWTSRENYKLTDQNPNTKYQISAQVCWGAKKLCSQTVSKSVTTLNSGIGLS